MLSIALIGALGKLGRRIAALSCDDPLLTIAAASTRHTHLGENLGTLIDKPSLNIILQPTPSLPFHLCDVIIDVSSIESTQEVLSLAVRHRKPLIIGSTGHDSALKASITQASAHIPLLLSSNFSLGIALCKQLTRHLSQSLASYSIDIIETHHIHKKDSPSGTSLSLAQATGMPNIPITSHRTGETIGEHTLVFTSPHEKIELKHTALSRDLFAHGALRAARWLAAQPCGLYTEMQ
jgi:4-hydroxy-tetrahydrodipicolinate reductase